MEPRKNELLVASNLCRIFAMIGFFQGTWPCVFSQNLRHRVFLAVDMRKLMESEMEREVTKATHSVKSSAWLPAQSTTNPEAGSACSLAQAQSRVPCVPPGPRFCLPYVA